VKAEQGLNNTYLVINLKNFSRQTVQDGKKISGIHCRKRQASKGEKKGVRNLYKIMQVKTGRG